MNLFWPILLGIALPCVGNAVELTSLSFNEALAAAEQAAPVVRAADARRLAARQSAIAAGELPDPKLVMGLDNLPVTGKDDWSLSRDFMTMQRVGISQDLPNAGKRRARVAQAEALIADAEFTTRAERLTARRNTALAWLASYFSAARLALQSDLSSENELLAKTVAARYAAGTANAADTLLPHREALVLADEKDDLLAAQAVANAQLAQVLGADARIAPAAELPHFTIDVEQLRRHLELHPDVRVADARLAGANAALREAEAAKHPDWTVEFDYQHRGPRYGEMVSAQVSVDLPLFSAHRQDPLIAARAEDVSALDEERAAMLREHQASLERDIADYQRLQNQAQRMDQQRLPLARQALDLAYQAYGANSGSLAELLEARRALAVLRLEALNLNAALLSAAAQLYFRNEDGAHE